LKKFWSRDGRGDLGFRGLRSIVLVLKSDTLLRIGTGIEKGMVKEEIRY
jgi:peptidyl-tRNA hydrolase